MSQWHILHGIQAARCSRQRVRYPRAPAAARKVMQASSNVAQRMFGDVADGLAIGASRLVRIIFVDPHHGSVALLSNGKIRCLPAKRGHGLSQAHTASVPVTEVTTQQCLERVSLSTTAKLNLRSACTRATCSKLQLCGGVGAGTCRRIVRVVLTVSGCTPRSDPSARSERHLSVCEPATEKALPADTDTDALPLERPRRGAQQPAQ